MSVCRLGPSVCLSVYLSTFRLENLKFSSYSFTDSDTRLIFGMKAHLIKTHLVVPKSMSSIKVKYQGHDFKKMAVSGAFLFHKHILFYHLQDFLVWIWTSLNPFPNKPCRGFYMSMIQAFWKRTIYPFPKVFSTCFDNFLPFSSNLKLLSVSSLSLEDS